jgi:hypothetical protein
MVSNINIFLLPAGITCCQQRTKGFPFPFPVLDLSENSRAHSFSRASLVIIQHNQQHLAANGFFRHFPRICSDQTDFPGNLEDRFPLSSISIAPQQLFFHSVSYSQPLSIEVWISALGNLFLVCSFSVLAVLAARISAITRPLSSLYCLLANPLLLHSLL